MSVPRRTVATMRLKLRKRSSDCEADSPDLGYMQWILSQVSANGWAVPGVLGGGVAPPWAYSIRFWATFGQPDPPPFGRPLDHPALPAPSPCPPPPHDHAAPPRNLPPPT